MIATQTKTERGTISIVDIVYDGSIYPREKPNSTAIAEYVESMRAGDIFPAIVVEQGTNRLLDGYHRWKAYQRYGEQYHQLSLEAKDEKLPAPITEIPCDYHVIPEGITPKLYALWLSTKNGVRVTDSEKRDAAIEQYQSRPGSSIKDIAFYTNVSRNKASEYIKALVAEFEETRNSIIQRLDLLGWTQTEVATKLRELFPEAKGVSQDNVSNLLREMHDDAFLVKSEVNKGHSVQTVAQRHNLPEILVWATTLQGLPDEQRMEKLEIKIQPYDVWNFPGSDDRFGAKHPGRIPGQLIAHVLYFFTEPGAVVIDPMSGSGTTQDVCLAMGRQCYAYDIDGRHGRTDVILHDIATDGWHERIKKADLIFWDPPYFEKMDSQNIGDEGYIDGSISKLGREYYLQFFRDAFRNAYDQVKPGTKFAFLMSDWDDETGEREGIFVWDYADILRNAGWTLKRQIQTPLSTQQVHPDIVNKFRQSRRLARLERYLLIAEKV